MAGASHWTDARLTRLFERYRRQYWPTSRRLKTFQARACSLEDGTYGRCDFETRVLQVDVSHHPSDRALRATVLHEMVHACVGVGGHHAPFWTQLEYLLSRRAPVTVGFPELGERGSHLSIIPPRFRRCRRLFRPVYERQQRAIERIAVDSEEILTPKDIEGQAYDAAVEGVPWRVVWGHLASTWGWVDLDGRVPPAAKPYQVAARRGHMQGRRFFREEQQTRARFAALLPDEKGGA